MKVYLLALFLVSSHQAWCWPNNQEATTQACTLICQKVAPQPFVLAPPGGRKKVTRGKAGPQGEKGEAGLPGADGTNCSCEKVEYFMNTELPRLQENMEILMMEKKQRDQALCSPRVRPVSGVYKMIPFADNSDEINVYCELTSEVDGWIVFQQRQNGAESFDRSWDEFVNGFGSLEAEHWLGLETMHKLTNSGVWEMKVIVEDFAGEVRHATYTNFSIGKGPDYKLHVGTFVGGNAGNGLEHPQNSHDGHAFTTSDHSGGKECADTYSSGWWFSYCYVSNLNGVYYAEGEYHDSWQGIIWYTWKGGSYSLRSSRMSFRKL